MSVRIANRSPSETSPIATPAIGDLMGTPASMSASVPPQTVAIEDEPLDSRMSETTRTGYGDASAVGRTGDSDRPATLPSPTARPGAPRMKFASPARKGGGTLLWAAGVATTPP